MAEPELQTLVPDEAPVVPVFFLSDSTGISAETMGNALLIQFPDLRFERTPDPVHHHGRGGARVVAILDEAMDGPVHAAGVHDRRRRRRCASELRQDPVPDHRLLRHAHEPGRGDPRAAAACTRRARLHGVGDIQQLQHPDGGHRVHDRARRRTEHARPRQGRRHPDRAVAVRQDADDACTSRSSTASSSPTTRWSTRTSSAPTCRGRSPTYVDRCVGLITTTVERLSRVRHERRPDSRYASARAVHAASCVAPRRAVRRQPDPGHRLLDQSVEEMATLIVQTLQSPRTGSHSARQRTDGAHDERQRPVVLRARDGRPRAGRRQERLARRDGLATCPTLGVRVPDGFATTADAYRRFIGDTGLAERISGLLDGPGHRRRAPAGRGRARRSAPRSSSSRSPTTSRPTSATAYDAAGRRATTGDVVRRAVVSATAEDLPDASFAGQQETFLNVARHRRGPARDPRGLRLALQRPGDRLPRAPRLRPRRRRRCRPGVQRMVRSDIGASGVMFTIDTESGFDDAVFITSSYGLGEARGAGRGEPRRVLRLQAGAARPAGRRS